MFLIEQKPGVYGLYDGENIIAEDLTEDQVVDALLQIQRPKVMAAVKAHKNSLSWEEALVWSGRVVCCNCGARVKKYNSNWPMERQRCNHCLG